MKNIFNFQQSFFSFLVAGLLAACQSTSTGIGGAVTTSSSTASVNNFSSTSEPKIKQIEVLDLSYEDAVSLSFDAMNSKYLIKFNFFLAGLQYQIDLFGRVMLKHLSSQFL